MQIKSVVSDSGGRFVNIWTHQPNKYTTPFNFTLEALPINLLTCIANTTTSPTSPLTQPYSVCPVISWITPPVADWLKQLCYLFRASFFVLLFTEPELYANTGSFQHTQLTAKEDIFAKFEDSLFRIRIADFTFNAKCLCHFIYPRRLRLIQRNEIKLLSILWIRGEIQNTSLVTQPQ